VVALVLLWLQDVPVRCLLLVLQLLVLPLMVQQQQQQQQQVAVLLWVQRLAVALVAGLTLGWSC
jgi:hypothetical protein